MKRFEPTEAVEAASGEQGNKNAQWLQTTSKFGCHARQDPACVVRVIRPPLRRSYREICYPGIPCQEIIDVGIEEREGDGTKGGQLSGPWKKLKKLKTRPRSAFQSTDRSGFVRMKQLFALNILTSLNQSKKSTVLFLATH